jgi:hypothetical protein
MSPTRPVNRDAIRIAVVVFGIAVLVGLASFISYRSASDLVAKGVHTTGEVVGFDRTIERRGGGPRPIFVFATQDGRSHRVVSDTYSILAPYYVGDRVPIVFYAGAPAAARIEDRMQLYALSMWSGALACLLLCFAAAAFLMRHKTHAGHANSYIQADRPGVAFDLSQPEGPWGIPKGHRLRFALWSCGLLSLPIVAAVTGDRSVLVVSTLTLGFEACLLLFSSMPDQLSVVKAMRVTNFYSRRYLWFQGTFWTLLMMFVVWRLYLQSVR